MTNPISYCATLGCDGSKDLVMAWCASWFYYLPLIGMQDLFSCHVVPRGFVIYHLPECKTLFMSCCASWFCYLPLTGMQDLFSCHVVPRGFIIYHLPECKTLFMSCCASWFCYLPFIAMQDLFSCHVVPRGFVIYHLSQCKTFFHVLLCLVVLLFTTYRNARPFFMSCISVICYTIEKNAKLVSFESREEGNRAEMNGLGP